MASSELLSDAAEIIPVTSPQDIAKVVQVESVAFGGEGEDIYTLAMIAKVGWIFAVPSPDTQNFQAAIELVPTKYPGVGFIHGVAVNPEVQSNGQNGNGKQKLGTKLIAKAESIAKDAGMEQIDATIAPTNGASLNAFLNKSGYRATHFYPNFYGEGEHRFWVSKNINQEFREFPEADWKRVLWNTQRHEGQHRIVHEDDYTILATLLNDEGYIAIGIIRPQYSGFDRNVLYLVKFPGGNQ